ncbi:hypothetical protein PFICI_07749 [Pestalotiopsis fici W106-1]|uniref:Uncharacterized protein n=1 Tax=Pestalotiopsis fici (strain W106-1 / CGMCC3.15140) TaxID=1229662 RepID=W3X2D2_PESFW|nr:uncharacterized protein PFICI_07749 [Pestalotiopsis fici W106-1]ETS80220.1 hypothetical protein PFICI_07749 [Pestalotiopsis fici W106-1]
MPVIQTDCRGCGCGQSGCYSCEDPLADPFFQQPESESELEVKAESVSESEQGDDAPYTEGPKLSSSLAPLRKRRRLADDGDVDERDGDVAPPVKRPDTDEVSFKEMVNALGEQTVRSTLIRLASMAPSAQVSIRHAYAQQLREERMPQHPLFYDSISKELWHMLYTSPASDIYRRTSSVHERHSLATQTAVKIGQRVRDMFFGIHENSPFATRLIVLETFRKILKSILLGGNCQELAGAVRHLFEPEPSSVRGGDVPDYLRMPGDYFFCVYTMSVEDRIRAGKTVDRDSTLADKFKWCRDEARRLGLKSFKPLDHLLREWGVPPDGQSWD